MTFSQTKLGILCLATGIALFSVQDLILKLVSSDYPLHQAMVIRSLVATPFLVLIVRVFDGRLGTIVTPGWWKMALRGLLNFVAYTTYYLALAALSMPLTVALYFTGPLFITLAAAVILRERIAPLSMLALLLGFASLLLIVRPDGAEISWTVALPVIGALFYAISMISARILGRTETAAAMAFWSNACFLLCAVILALIFSGGAYYTPSDAALAFLTRGWVWPSLWDFGLMAACGIVAAIGLTLMSHAYRIAAASAMAPIEYSFMIWALLWGWLFWGDLPDGLAWIGILALVSAGLVLMRQDRTSAPATTS